MPPPRVLSEARARSGVNDGRSVVVPPRTSAYVVSAIAGGVRAAVIAG